jgi:hypothetical protein
MSLASGGASDDSKLTGFGCFGPSDKVSDWIADQVAEGPTGIDPWEVDYLPLCRHRVGTVYSFLNIHTCRCLDAKTSCRINKLGYPLANNCYRRHILYNSLVRAAKQL